MDPLFSSLLEPIPTEPTFTAGSVKSDFQLTAAFRIRPTGTMVISIALRLDGVTKLGRLLQSQEVLTVQTLSSQPSRST